MKDGVHDVILASSLLVCGTEGTVLSLLDVVEHWAPYTQEIQISWFQNTSLGHNLTLNQYFTSIMT